MASSQQAQASSSSITAAAVEDKRSFSSLGVPVSLVRALAALSIVTPTPIQRESLPSILSGLDLIAGSPTGSGKTLSFALPILTQLSRDMVAGFAVVLTPTRELAAQLHEQFVAVAEGANMGVRTALVLGGEDMMSQARVLAERPNVVVATPGRLADLLTSNGEHEALRRCRYVVSAYILLLRNAMAKLTRSNTSGTGRSRPATDTYLCRATSRHLCSPAASRVTPDAPLQRHTYAAD